MTEKQNPHIVMHSKARRFCRFALCVCRGLFVLLLVAVLLVGLYFRAPLKILALIAILLSLLTFVPKPWRKYGRLTLAAILLATTVWVFIPQHDTDWVSYVPNEKIRAFNAKHAVPHEENAAIVYDRLFAKIRHACKKDETEISRFFYMPHNEVDNDKVEVWLSENKQEVFDTLKAASQNNKCYWVMNSEGNSFNYTDLEILKYVTGFLLDQIAMDIQAQDTPSAIEKLSWGFACASHLMQQPNHTHYLVAMAIEAMFSRPKRDVIVTMDLDDIQLEKLAKLSQVHEWRSFLDRYAEYATLQNKVRFTSAIYEIDAYQKYRFSGNLMGIGFSIIDHWYMMPLMLQEIKNSYWRERISKLCRIINWWYVPSSPNDLMAMFDEYAHIYLLLDTTIHNEDIFHDMSWKTAQFNCNYLVKLNIVFQAGPLFKIYQIDTRLNSEKTATQIMLAARKYRRQHNDWPESLKTLQMIDPDLNITDPLNDMEFVYRKTGDDFVLYSKGLNGIDEGGRMNKEADDWLFWPKTLEEIN